MSNNCRKKHLRDESWKNPFNWVKFVTFRADQASLFHAVKEYSKHREVREKRDMVQAAEACAMSHFFSRLYIGHHVNVLFLCDTQWLMGMCLCWHGSSAEALCVNLLTAVTTNLAFGPDHIQIHWPAVRRLLFRSQSPAHIQVVVFSLEPGFLHTYSLLLAL